MVASILNPGLVSIVVASYNYAGHLERRMESLLGQTYQNIEILVIDDCSTDNSVEILRRYDTHPKVRLILRECNGGVFTVSNQGVEMSAGEFVLFAQCDDYCDPRMIERLVASMMSNPSAGIVFCRSLLVNKDDQILGDDLAYQALPFRYRCAGNTFITGAEMSRFLLHACVIPNFSAALFRKECFTKVGYLSTAYHACSDWDLYFRIADKYDFAYVAEPLNSFRQHEMTIRSVMKGSTNLVEYFRVLLGYTNTLELSLTERASSRMHVMFLWAAHILPPSFGGIYNFPHHLRWVLRLDPLALIFLPLSLLARVFNLFSKALTYSGRWLRTKLK